MKLLVVLTFLTSFSVFSGDNKVKVEITSLTNVNKASAMEVCGTAKHSDGLRPILVTVKHDESKYTTLTSPDDAWCVVIKRWTFDGKLDATGLALKDLM